MLIKKTLSIIIAISLLLSMSTTSFASPGIDLQTSEQEFIDEIKDSSNIEIEPNSTMQNMEYTYIDNGKTYKVIETANADLTYVYSEIYAKNSTGDYTLEYSTITEVNESSICVTKRKNGETTQNTIDLKQIEGSAAKYNSTQDIKSYSIPPISDWEHHSTLNYSYRIYTYTLVAVTAVVTGVAAAAGGAFISGLASVVSYIIDDHIPKVWYTQYIYRKWRKWPNPPWEVVAEWSATFHYSDSERTDYIGYTSSEYRLE